MHEEIFELFACRWLWQRKPLFQMGKGSCQIVLSSNNSHTLCFQGPGSTVVRFSVELLVLLPGLVLGVVLRVPVPARLEVLPQEAAPCPRQRETPLRISEALARLHHQLGQTAGLTTKCSSHVQLSSLPCVHIPQDIHALQGGRGQKNKWS